MVEVEEGEREVELDRMIAGLILLLLRLPLLVILTEMGLGKKR